MSWSCEIEASLEKIRKLKQGTSTIVVVLVGYAQTSTTQIIEKCLQNN